MKIVGKFLFVSILSTLISSTASAMLVPDGGAREDNSWSQGWFYDAGSVDWMGIIWLSGSKFESPAFRNMTLDASGLPPSGWHNYDPLDVYAYANGPAIAERVNFFIYWQGNISDGGTQLLFKSAYNNVTQRVNLVTGTYFSSDGGYIDWVVRSSNDAEWDRRYAALNFEAVPEPATLSLLGLGLLGLVLKKKKTT